MSALQQPMQEQLMVTALILLKGKNMEYKNPCPSNN